MSALTFHVPSSVCYFLIYCIVKRHQKLHFLLTVILCTVSFSLSLKSYNNNTYRLIPQIIFSNSIHSHLFFNEKLHQLLVKNENVLIIALFLINNNENISSNFHLRHTCLLMSWLHTKLNFLNLYCNWRLR